MEGWFGTLRARVSRLVRRAYSLTSARRATFDAIHCFMATYNLAIKERQHPKHHQELRGSLAVFGLECAATCSRRTPNRERASRGAGAQVFCKGPQGGTRVYAARGNATTWL